MSTRGRFRVAPIRRLAGGFVLLCCWLLSGGHPAVVRSKVIRRQTQKPSGGIWPQNLVVIRRAAGGQNLSGGFQNSSGGVGQRAGNRAKFAPICKNSAFSDRSHRPITQPAAICSTTAPDFLSRSRCFCLLSAWFRCIFPTYGFHTDSKQTNKQGITHDSLHMQRAS